VYGEHVRVPQTTKQGAEDVRLFSREKTRHITWNEDNKPATITVNGTAVNFIYDGNGNRVRKIKGSNSTYYFGDAYETRNTVGIIHLFANHQRLASIRTDGKIQYYHGNHLGSASIITDQNGNLKQKIEYFPYGTYRAKGSQSGTYDYDTTFPNANYTFTDQEDDDETGLYNYDARLYDPQLGRFISTDSIVPKQKELQVSYSINAQPTDNTDLKNSHHRDLQALNRYSYCLNNPLMYTDPSGHDPANGTSWSEDGMMDPGWTVGDNGSVSFNANASFGGDRSNELSNVINKISVSPFGISLTLVGGWGTKSLGFNVTVSFGISANNVSFTGSFTNYSNIYGAFAGFGTSYGASVSKSQSSITSSQTFAGGAAWGKGGDVQVSKGKDGDTSVSGGASDKAGYGAYVATGTTTNVSATRSWSEIEADARAAKTCIENIINYIWRK